MSNAIAIVNRDSILDKLRRGMLLKEIAAELGVSKQAISEPLKSDPEYQLALFEQADSLIDETKEMTWEARDAIDIARARECTKWAFRYAESINARKWAPQSKQTVTHEMGASTLPDTFANALLDGKRVFEGESERVDGGSE